MTPAERRGYVRAQGQPAEEPLNVQVARALGWRALHFDTVARRWVGMVDQYPLRCAVPDFAADPAWVLRTIDAHGLDVVHQVGAPPGTVAIGHIDSERGVFDRRFPVSFGRPVGTAVCRWVVAAHAAGIEVKQ
jgi:hypothetical protein